MIEDIDVNAVKLKSERSAVVSKYLPPMTRNLCGSVIFMSIKITVKTFNNVARLVR